jgi:hypothetical protein
VHEHTRPQTPMAAPGPTVPLQSLPARSVKIHPCGLSQLAAALDTTSALSGGLPLPPSRIVLPTALAVCSTFLQQTRLSPHVFSEPASTPRRFSIARFLIGLFSLCQQDVNLDTLNQGCTFGLSVCNFLALTPDNPLHSVIFGLG